jgi:membrane protein YqaA with SNARE-associated domain
MLSWLPFVGDAMAVALGFFRVAWVPSFFFILLGKFLRYLFIVGIFYLGWL